MPRAPKGRPAVSSESAHAGPARRSRTAPSRASDEALAAAMLGAMPGLAYAHDRAGRLLRWNRNLEAASGRSRDEVARMHPRDFFEPSDRPSLDECILEAFETGESRFDATFVGVGGTRTAYSLTCRRVDVGDDACLLGVGVEIPPRTLDRLAESEKRYRDLVEHANSIILRWDAQGRVTFLNEFGLRFFGYASDEIVGRHVVGTIVPLVETGGRNLETLMDEVCAAPDSFEYNVNENVRRNGDRVWIAWTNRIVRDAQGAVVELLSVGTDITERRRSEEARRAADVKLRNEKLFSDSMIESMPGVLYLYDANGRFLRWNRNFETVSGYSAGEIARLHPRDFFSDDEKPRVEAAIARVHATGDATIEAPLRVRDGSETPYFFTGRRVDYPEGPCVVGVGIDISERKEAELRFHALFEQTPVGVVVLDPETGGILECNEQAARQLGHSRDELTLMRLADIAASDDADAIRDRLASLPEGGTTQLEMRQRTRSGEVLHVLVSAQAIELSGKKVLHCVFHDITDRHRIAVEREKRDRAEAADRLKSAFLATMSHELRTPLNSIIGFTGILLKGLAGPLTAEQSKQLEMVRTSGRHLLRLINDVLDISKIEAGQLEVARERFDPKHSISTVIESVKPQVDAKGLALRVHVPEALPEAIGDERRFEQVLLNLLSNAIKFTERGEISLSASLVDGFLPPDGQPARRAIRLSVADTGIGIKREDLPELFVPFRQVESGLARSHDGSGLGLAICRRLVELMGGEIAVTSAWGEGSTFTVTLPLQEGERP